MVFSSMIFLCFFLPVIYLLYLAAPGIKAKNVVLVFASLVFYAYGEPVYIVLLLGSSIVNYGLACLIDHWPERKRTVIVSAVVLNLAMLAVFKYAGFLMEAVNSLLHLQIPVPSIRMPIGISFFTFQAISYVIDVYRGRTKAQKNFGKILLYISFFPQLIAGPIVKYHDIAEEIDHRQITAEGTAAGIRRFIAGLCKKVLIANAMGLAADTLFAVPMQQVNGTAAWLGAISYMFQIYFDFSGYSDMAIGLGWMFGFHFRENFNYPYMSSSIREFWRRWHISLSGWFKEYLYIPLGGNRKGKGRTVLNKLVVFFFTGLWHGSSFHFVFWGLYHGFFLMMEEYIPAIGEKGGKMKRFFQHVYTLLVVCIGFVFFRAENITQGCSWVRKMFTDFRFDTLSMAVPYQILTPHYLLALAAACIASMPVVQKRKGRSGYEAAAFVCSIAGLLICMLLLAGDTYNPFIYFRF